MSDGEQCGAYTKRAQCGAYSLTHDHKCALKHLSEHHRQFMLIHWRNPLLVREFGAQADVSLYGPLATSVWEPMRFSNGVLLQAAWFKCSVAPDFFLSSET